MALSSLIYVSIRAVDCTESDIEKILDSSNRNNPQLDITGVLLFTPTRFIQYLEGPYPEILQLYHSIKADRRHNNVLLVSLNKEGIEERLFSSWAMGGKKLSEDSLEFMTELPESEKLQFMNIINGKVEGSEDFSKTLAKVFT